MFLPLSSNVSQMVFVTQHNKPIEFQIIVHGEILAEYLQVILASIILVGVYVLIGFDVSCADQCSIFMPDNDIPSLLSPQVVHRTMAAMIGSTCTLGVLSMLHKVQLIIIQLTLSLISHLVFLSETFTP